ncbi:hypothetical protein NDU88_003771 [Pleurodeles waltl]|uniref:Uncharacterized protein n=1 Tax=Pleurodeles waltl TaxID=8319 RepID=A0AAV7M6B1_PLEWA|nr:hypothetical protein NDU88_003771 [Pleurodeles waltl]
MLVSVVAVSYGGAAADATTAAPEPETASSNWEAASKSLVKENQMGYAIIEVDLARCNHLQQDPASHLRDPANEAAAKGAWSGTILRAPSPALIAPARQDPQRR